MEHLHLAWRMQKPTVIFKRLCIFSSRYKAQQDLDIADVMVFLVASFFGSLAANPRASVTIKLTRPQWKSLNSTSCPVK